MRKWGSINLKIKGERVPTCRNPKYLGVILDRSLTWRAQAKHAIKNATRRINLLKRLSSPKTGLNTAILRTIAQSFVYPTLTYASPIWLVHLARYNSHQFKTIEALDRKIKRLVLGAINSTPGISLDIETAIPPTHHTIAKQTLRFVIKAQFHHQNTWATLALQSPLDSPLNILLQQARQLSLLSPDLIRHHYDNPTYQPPPNDPDSLIMKTNTHLTDAWQEIWNTDKTARNHYTK
jgi:hypothetical protein